MEKSKRMCCLPQVVTASMMMEYFNLSCGEFDYIVESRCLTSFRTESNRFYFTGAVIEAIGELIAESSEINDAITDASYRVFLDTYNAMFQMKRPKERARLDAIKSVFTTFDGDFAEFAKSIIFDWQYDLCGITQKRFLTVLQRLEWLTETGKKRLRDLEEKHHE